MKYLDPKFTPHSIADKRMMVLWLRFLTEIDANTQEVPSAGFTPEQVAVATSLSVGDVEKL